MILLMLLLVAADPQPAPTATTKPVASAPDKLVCKQFAITGSLVGSKKICKTRREWDIERENVRAVLPGTASCANLGESRGC